MKRYIDKSALLVEIEKWMTLLTKEKNQEGASKIDKLSLGGRIAELQEVKVFLDTLEVKEVDLEKELNDFIEQQKAWIKDDRVVEYNNGDSFNHIYDLEKIAKHFFELGLKIAQKGE